MEGFITIQGVPADKFMESLGEVIQQKVDEAVRRIKAEELQETFLSPEQTRKLFDPMVSLVTLNDWASKGFLNKHHIGGRTYYKYSEVIAATKTLKRYSRK